MVFSSLTFLFLFLPITLILYYAVPKKVKNLVLLVMSLVFYAWGEPVYVILMLYSILLNFAAGRLMEAEPKHKKAVLVFAVILNLLILGFFKYYGFAVGSVNKAFGLSIPIRDIALPIGISFYTFQALSYVIDLYRGKFPAQRNFINFACYITMFPQLIAGPIVRYEEIEQQLGERRLTLARFGKGALRFIFGLGKKVLLANLAGALFDEIHALPQLSFATSWIGALSYTFQIYFDFSGYSDMAIGLGDMLGFRFSENFNYPYAACSVTEFWRRWHISLGTWFREYVYIPLGGNRVKVARHILNVMVVWLLTGLWHGAGWTFIVWGVFYGVLLIFEKYVLNKLKIPKAVRWLLTMLAVIIGWVIFSADDLIGAGRMLAAMTSVPAIAAAIRGDAGASALFSGNAMYFLSTGGILLAIEAVFSGPWMGKITKAFKKKVPGRVALAVFAVALLVLSIAFLATENYNPFLYFRF